MNISSDSLLGVKLIQPDYHYDDRGYFTELCHTAKYQKLLGIDDSFVQTNFSHSCRHVLRGLHLQTQHPQGKLIQCLQGSVYDVAVDLREESESFGKWVGFELSDTNKHQLWIPPGFAHGFVCLTDTADIVYHCTDYYHPEFEAVLLWDDPDVNIQWPVEQPLLSDKDQKGKTLEELYR